jgi:hypothetical protein
MHEIWLTATAALRQVLATTTLAELAALDQSIETGSYPIPESPHRTASEEPIGTVRGARPTKG